MDSKIHKNIGVAVIWNDEDEILIDKRKGGFFDGFWEFPGGKLEVGETMENCIKREIREELAIEIAVGDHLISIDYDYHEYLVTLNVYHCYHISGVPQPLECDEIRWVSLREIDRFTFPPANERIIVALHSINDEITF